MTTDQLSFWDDAEPAEPLMWCPGTIERDGQTLYYAGGLLEGTPRYEPRPDLDAIAGVPYDLASRGWRRHPFKAEWLMLDEPGKPAIVCTSGERAARVCEATWAAIEAKKAAHEATKPARRKKQAA